MVNGARQYRHRGEFINYDMTSPPIAHTFSEQYLDQATPWGQLSGKTVAKVMQAFKMRVKSTRTMVT